MVSAKRGRGFGEGERELCGRRRVELRSARAWRAAATEAAAVRAQRGRLVEEKGREGVGGPSPSGASVCGREEVKRN